MERPDAGPFPTQLSQGECSWWGGGTDCRSGKRLGSRPAPLIPPKLPRIAEQGSYGSFDMYPPLGRVGCNSSSVSIKHSNEAGENSVEISPAPKLETTSPSVPSNDSLATVQEDFIELKSGERVYMSDLVEISSEVGTCDYSYNLNGSVWPAFSSHSPNTSSCHEDTECLESKFSIETAVAMSADDDKPCSDLYNKMPKPVTNSEENTAPKENDCEIQCCGDVSEASDDATVLVGKGDEHVECEEQLACNVEVQNAREELPESSEVGSSTLDVDVQNTVGLSNDQVLSREGKKLEEVTVPSRSRRCPFSAQVAADECSLVEGGPCLESIAVDSLAQELSFPHESGVDNCETVQVARQQDELVQDFCMPGTSREQREADNGEDDIHSTSSFNSDIPDEEIEAMLEEGLLRKSEKNVLEVQFNQREKIVLDELGHDHFDVLPEGWVKVTHNSGMPVYLHKETRVCNITKPYFLGPGSTKKHEIPLSAIPCLQYLRALEEEQAYKRKVAITVGPGGIELPKACIETAEENKAKHSLTIDQVHDYCQKRFSTKKISVARAKKDSGKKKRCEKLISRPTLPEGTKLIKFPVENKRPVLNNTRKKKEWILNPNGKSFVCILHEYVQHALKKQPSYIFKETEQPGQPFSASVMIDTVQYGVGCGSSKKHAKSEAAKQTLEILIPEMREKIQEDRRAGHCKASTCRNTDLSIFDEIRIEDPRVAELCAKTTEPSPYAILLTCLQRNFGLGELDIKCEVRAVRHLNIEYMMSVGKHTAVVMCKNKRDGKQQTSQAILQKLHPHIKTWGSILRMYGSSSMRSIKDKKHEEQEITFLQSKAEENEPNYAILGKLEDTMLKLAREYRSIGKFIPPSDEKLPSSATTDLNSVSM